MSLAGRQEPLLAPAHNIITETILQGNQQGKRRPGCQIKKKLARQYTRIDTSKPTNPATHSRGHATMASTVNEWHPYDRPGQGTKVIVTVGSSKETHREYDAIVL